LPTALAPTPVHKSGSSKTLKEKAAELAAKQQCKGAKGQHKDVEGLTIAGIRALPGMTPEIEEWMTRLQRAVPSLAKTPTAPSASGVSFQPPGVLAGNHTVPGQTSFGRTGGEDFDMDFVYSTSRGKLVPVVHDSPGRGGSVLLQSSTRQSGVRKTSSMAKTPLADSSDPEGDDASTSEDEECPVEPAKGYEFVWYRDKHGKKYFLHKLARECNSPKLVKTYVCDETTGRWYEKMVPKDSGIHLGVKKAKEQCQKQSLSTPAYVDHRVSSTTPIPHMSRGVRTPAAPIPPSKGERLPGFFQGDPEKQGKDSKMPDLVQWARNCPVNWTTKVTSDKINAVLWAWSFVSELLATRTGQAPNLEPGELEARLQHFCNVLEITLQSSNQSDFCGDAWNVARLYDQKVQQKVDCNQFSWLQLSVMNHGASHPHELMAAHQELAKKPKIIGGNGNVKGGNGGKDNTKQKNKMKCRTWNRSEVRGKCTYEVENAPEKCQFSHECSYCKSKSLKPVDHQRLFCKKRLEEEG
jgi:hypothetical protein